MNRPFGLPGNGPIQRFERREAQGFLPRGYIDGLTLSNDTTDATNDIAISAGVCRSTVNVIDGVASTRARDQMDMEIPVGIIKQLDVAWAPENYDDEGFSGGDRSGGRSPSAISNTTWHTLVIGGPGMPADVLFHDSATQSSIVAALPSEYTAYRRIGSILRESAAIVAFVQDGDFFQRVTHVADVAANTTGTAAVTRTLSVPVGINVLAQVVGGVRNLDAGTPAFLLLTDLATTDATPSTSLSHISAALTAAGGAREGFGPPMFVRTNTSAQIRSRMGSYGGGNATLHIATFGWRDSRGRDA